MSLRQDSGTVLDAGVYWYGVGQACDEARVGLIALT